MVKRQHQYRYHTAQANDIGNSQQGVPKQNQPGFAPLGASKQLPEAAAGSEYDLSGVQSRQRYVDK